MPSKRGVTVGRLASSQLFVALSREHRRRISRRFVGFRVASRAERIVDRRTNGPTGGRDATSRMIFKREQCLSYPFATIVKKTKDNSKNDKLLIVKKLFIFILDYSDHLKI